MFKLFIATLTLLAGIASSTQGLFNGYWKDEIDLKTVMLVNSLVVLSFVVLFFIVTYNDGVKLSLDKMNPTILVGGTCGFFIIMILAVSFPTIGATATSLIFIVGLLSSALVYDHIGALNLIQKEMNFQKIIGILLVVIGTFLALKNPS